MAGNDGWGPLAFANCKARFASEVVGKRFGPRSSPKIAAE